MQNGIITNIIARKQLVDHAREIASMVAKQNTLAIFNKTSVPDLALLENLKNFQNELLKEKIILIRFNDLNELYTQIIKPVNDRLLKNGR